VLLAVPRRGGWLRWAPVWNRFEERRAAQEGPTVITPHIDGEIRRGCDYVRVTVSVTVTSPNVAQALTAAFWAFRKAANGDLDGRDMAGASAEVQPEGVHRPLYEIEGLVFSALGLDPGTPPGASHSRTRPARKL
jgi:hypothetical protein